MNNSKNTQVLVVGAGPTGLAAAASLLQLGISVRVIDRDLARSDKSKALGVQAGTLECLERSLGPSISKRMIAAGRPVHEAHIHFDEREPITINFKTIPSKYNYILILAQSETERILEEFLAANGLRVERDTELLSLEQTETQVTSRVRRGNGEEETIASNFVMGCDGSHSAVRHLLDLPFEGGTYDGDFILGDVKLKWQWGYDSIRNFMTKHGVVASFPLKGENNYRLILIPKGLEPNVTGNDISLDKFRELTSQLSGGRIQVESATWLSRFRVHRRMVNHFQKNRVFLSGDAAHIHSPAGGQGMNTGIQDALNLAHKLNAYFRGKISFLNLSDYEAERMPVAKAVLRSTDFFSRMMLMPDNFVTENLRRYVLPRIVSSKMVQRKVTAAISEMGFANREIARYQSEIAPDA